LIVKGKENWTGPFCTMSSIWSLYWNVFVG